MEAIISSETLVTAYETTRRQNYAAQNSNFHCCDNLKRHNGSLHPDMIVRIFKLSRSNTESDQGESKSQNARTRALLKVNSRTLFENKNQDLKV